MPSRSQWSEKAAASLQGRDLLVCATRLIGADPNLVLWGARNSSIKLTMPDHRDRETDVLWIKGTGSDKLTIIPSHFIPLRMDDLVLLKDRLAITDEEMVGYQARCVLQPSSPNPSIETLLHAFISAPYVYHTHADFDLRFDRRLG